MEIYVGSQIPYQDRHQVASSLGWPDERVRILGQLMGGGFGGKEDIAGQIHAALLAHATGRPVKLLFDRHERLLVHPKRHATQIRVKIGARRDGRLTAAETELYGDTGAYASLGEKVMTRATTHSAGPYDFPNVRADCYAMYTNNPPAGAFRGFGVTQTGALADSVRTAEMRGHLLGQLYASRLPQRLRFVTAIGHKTGDIPPVLGNDIGIIYAPKGPIVVAVFTNENRGDFFVVESTMGNIARDLFEAWGR